MMPYLKVYLTALCTFLVVDILWIGLVARTFYKNQIGFLLAPSPNWVAAGIFYLIFIAGLMFFVVIPGLKEDALKPCLVRAALFGLITYGTYDLTNLATVKDWPVLVTVVDMIWGVLLSMAVSMVSFKTGKRLTGSNLI